MALQKRSEAMTAREVSEQLGLREFLDLCQAVDTSHGPGTKFEVVNIARDPESGLIHCLIFCNEVPVHIVDIRMHADEAHASERIA